MKREEKNLQTRQKIMDAALAEFGKNGYADGSMNAICAAGEVSKGIVYHYFKDKDALYLLCVEACFDALTQRLAGVVKECLDAPTAPELVEPLLGCYFDARSAFFEENPLYHSLFCGAVIMPPAHLRPQIDAAKAKFDALNLLVLTGLLGRAELCPGVTVMEVAEVFREYQDFANARFRLQGLGDAALREHEARCRRFIKILLYGVVERKR